MIKFSVIIPIYNAEKYVERCVRSVLNQNYLNIEVILVNDGSTDTSEIICKRLAEEDLRIIYYKQDNQGPSIARQTGLSLASGDYISFVDADDYLENGLYMDLFSICESGIDIVEFSYVTVWDKGKQLHELTPIQKEGIKCLSHYVYQKNVTNYLWNKVFKKDLFDEVEFPELFLSEDQCVLAQLYYFSKRIVTVKSAYYNYFTNPVSLCNSSFTTRTMDVLKANDYIYDFLIKKHIEFAAVQSVMGVNSAILVYNKADLTYSGRDKKTIKKQIKREYNKWLNIAKKCGIYQSISGRQKLKWILFKFAPNITSLMRKIKEGSYE